MRLKAGVAKWRSQACWKSVGLKITRAGAVVRRAGVGGVGLLLLLLLLVVVVVEVADEEELRRAMRYCVSGTVAVFEGGRME